MKLWKENERTRVTIFCEIGRNVCKSYWTSPQASIDHADLNYIKGRYPSITTEKRAEEFKMHYRNLFIEVSVEQMELMKHALGLNYKKHPYRNRFFTNHEDQDWNTLVDKGLAFKSKKQPNNDGNVYFWLTKLGVEFVTGKIISKEDYEDL